MTTATVTELFRDLERGGRAIAATRRLARQVEQNYAVWKAQGGANAWPTPQIRVYEDWLEAAWRAAFDEAPGAPRLLTDDQELLLWEQVIKRRAASGSGRALLQLSGTARTARRTWSRIHAWRLDWQHLREHRSADSEAFMDWAQAVQQTLFERNWLTTAQLPQYLLDHAAGWLDAQGRAMWWMGFDVMPPAAVELVGQLTAHGFEQKRFDNAGFDDARVDVVACRDTDDEWRRIARWARAELAADPQVRLGVVCPDLHRRRDEVEEIMEDILHPELAWRVDTPRVFHLSLGRALPDYPIAGSALDVLRWTGRRIPFDVVSRTLRSSYVASSDDLDARVELELALRNKGQESFDIGFVQTLAAERAELEAFAGRLAAARTLDPGGRDDPGGWSAFFSDWLRAFNWPGDRSVDSHEHQVLNAWREQLSRFAGLNTVQDRWTLGEALGKLSSMAAARILQFHDDQAPLQIMGSAEAAALWFDKAWLANMSDAVWPPAPQPDPFIPVSLQKSSGMPDASAGSVLARTRVRTASLLGGARSIRVSYAAESAEAPASVSPLFIDYPCVDAYENGVYEGRVAQLSRARPRLAAVEDQRAPALGGGPLRGGVGLVADQARCPFRALAHYRLQARALEAVQPGLDPRTRGLLVHDALKRLWDRLGDRDGLVALDEAGLAELAEACAAGALESQFADSAFQQHFLAIERTRVAQLLCEWTELEQGRPWFRVAATEEGRHVELGGIRFKVRVDRIDELADGRRLIIDYKTGQLTGVGDWAAPRMEEPQLPMYALSIDEQVAALALAGVRRGECELRGVTDDVDNMPSLKPLSELEFEDMASLRSWWTSTLGELVAAHRDGDARVDPKTPQTCRYCDVMPLCRVFERGESVG